MTNDMDKNFDFDKIGKRMPYSVPDGFFAKMEDNVLAQVERQRRRIVIRSLLAVAAAVALFFVVRTTLPSTTNTQQPTPFADVEVAFNNLSTDDQEFLINLYADDELMEADTP